jgi:glutamyl-tRNA synthetase
MFVLGLARDGASLARAGRPCHNRAVSQSGISRLAPSPTGALHLGNARTFLVNWILARKMGWKIILRIEDIDGPRIKRGAERGMIEDLHWLGVDWDEGPVYQSQRLGKYREAIERLIVAGKAYPCVCSRKEVEAAASAPHAEDGAAVYPGTCRGKFASMAEAERSAGKPGCVRFDVGDAAVEFEDQFAGKKQFDVRRELGDFVIAKADGTPAYQLAVVVDDAEMGVDRVVRGDDLLNSTPRQILVYRALGMGERIPEYWHLPLVVGEDGRRLAKRHGDTRLSTYRQRGVKAERVVALLARWCGMKDVGEGVEARDLVKSFRIEEVPKGAIVFTAKEDRWLVG